ncbi:hypothetical protein ACYCFL_05590 [Stutzerimonas nitrititolerans]|uniref:hypothetical protein n=1 Tax=Stutzerimonas nitrititolerans TaxID=2482751 RepID=UPI00289F14A1|nr:hypothetical protein [Stutzerimonas nitrititolerans]
MNGREKIPVGFRYSAELTDHDGKVVDAWADDNLIPLLGIHQLIKAPFGDAEPIGAFYLGLFRNNALPTDATKAADIPAVLGEFTQYSEETRPLWDRAYDNAGTYSNEAARAEFNFTVDQTIYGAFMASSAEKGSVTGLLLSAVRFTTPRLIYAGLTLKITASITYVSNDL